MADYAWHSDSAKDNVLYDLVWKPTQAVSVSSWTTLQLVMFYNTKTMCLSGTDGGTEVVAVSYSICTWFCHQIFVISVVTSKQLWQEGLLRVAALVLLMPFCVFAAFMLHLWFGLTWVPSLQVRLLNTVTTTVCKVLATWNGHLACHFSCRKYFHT